LGYILDKTEENNSLDKDGKKYLWPISPGKTFSGLLFFEEQL